MKVSHCLLRRNFPAWILWSFLIFVWSQPVRAQINNWLSSSSGDWESPQWSFGLPGFYEDIFITNAGVKTIVIEQVTTEYNPSILNIEGLTLSAPAGSSNTLFFNYAGLQSPLSMANLSVGANATVVVDGSALVATNSFILDSVFTQDKSSVVETGILGMGQKNSATYYLDSGILTAGDEVVGASFPSVFLQKTGTNDCRNSTINGSSEFDLMGGEFDGVVQLSAGGTFKIEGGLCNDAAIWSEGNFIQSGGIISNSAILEPPGMTLPIDPIVGHQAGATGTAVQTGGTNMQVSLTLGLQQPVMSRGMVTNTTSNGGIYTLSNGYLATGNTYIWSAGTMEQSGGRDIISGTLSLQGSVYIVDGAQTSGVINGWTIASYSLTGGELEASNLTIGVGGDFIQSGGTNIVPGTLSFTAFITLLGQTIGNPGTVTTISGNYNLNGGLLSVSNLSAGVPSGFSQSGGQLLAQNISGNISQSGGTNNVGNLSANYSLSGGMLITTNVLVTNGAVFQHSGGKFSIPSITLDNGTWQELTNGASLGPLQLGAGTNSIIQLPANACFLQFADSSGLAWSNSGVLTIVNWNGSTNGLGTNVIQFGTDSSGLTAQQLGRIQFANPVGLPPGNYLANILSTGEIVPGDRSYLESAPAPFFTGEASMGGDWYYLAGSNQVFGYYDLVDFPYVYHMDMGWEYFINAANGMRGGYFYDFTDGVWFYTQPSLFPYVYDFTANAWQYYEPQTGTPGRYSSNPRWFYNFTTQAWGNHL